MKALLALLLVLPPLALLAARPDDHPVRAPLAAADGSGVTGYVELTRHAHGGTDVLLVAHGLRADSSYASFDYANLDCAGDRDLLSTFAAKAGGEAEVHTHLDRDVDEVGSIGIRSGPGYGTALACANVH